MISAEIPANESQRLEVLKSYSILDTPAEASFDRLTEAAALICGTPMALISLVDAERQWFKSNFGVPFKETKREFSFCAHAILRSGPFVVNDTLEDPRFDQNPLVLGEPGLRYYAGMPLECSKGVRVGTLCVLDVKPGNLTETQARLLKVLSDQVVEKMESKALLIANAQSKVMSDASEGISHEINSALTILFSYSDLLKKVDFGENGGVAKMLLFSEKIRGASERIASVHKGLRDALLVRPGGVREYMNLTEIVTQALLLCSPRGKAEGVTVLLNPGDQVEPVLGRKNEVTLVLLTLVNQAIQISKVSTEKWVQVWISRVADQVLVQIKFGGNLQNAESEKGESHSKIEAGLLISKVIMRDHGGELSHEQRSESGSFIMKFQRKFVSN